MRHMPTFPSRAAMRVLVLPFVVLLACRSDDVMAPLAGDLLVVESTREGGVRRLYTMRSDGTDVRPLIASFSSTPSFAPDRRRLAFMSHLDGEIGVVVSGIDGGGFRPLVPQGRDPRWSPDGRRVAAWVASGGELVVADAVGASTRLRRPGTQLFYSWSPDGTRLLVYVQGGALPNLLVLPASGGDALPLQTGMPAVAAATYSPSGAEVAFGCRPNPEQTSYADICIVPASGGVSRPLTMHEGQTSFVRVAQPVWSPDGNHIAFIGVPHGVVDGPHQLWVTAADGSGVTRLTTEHDLGFHAPLWSPDSRWLAYAANAGGGSWSRDVWVVEARAGALPVRVTDDAEDDVPWAWFP